VNAILLSGLIAPFVTKAPIPILAMTDCRRGVAIEPARSPLKKWLSARLEQEYYSRQVEVHAEIID
jgi:hypothetical protein